MSGGTDSTVAGYLLKEAGWKVEALHLLLPGPQELVEKRLALAKRASQVLGIELNTLDISESFEKTVIGPFFESYLGGLTPNPCVRCNERLKFPSLEAFARSMAVSYIATGHYALLKRSDDGVFLFRGLDRSRDQAYFLHRVREDILKKTVFPLGGLKKSHVRDLARGLGIGPLEESREVCFLGDESYRARLGSSPEHVGDIVDSLGRVVGRHPGIHLFTVGQRHGLGVCGPHPLYVKAILPETRKVVISCREDIYQRDVHACDWLWCGKHYEGHELRCDAQIRYKQKGAPGVLRIVSQTEVVFTFDEPQWAVTPGQALVCYLEDRVIGGGRIKAGP